VINVNRERRRKNGSEEERRPQKTDGRAPKERRAEKKIERIGDVHDFIRFGGGTS